MPLTPTVEQHSLQQHLNAAQSRRRLLAARAAGRTLTEIDCYPARPARENTPGFRNIHYEMIVVEDTPCHICGVTHSLLADVAKSADPLLNPFGATQMELHHKEIECQLALAISLDKFNVRLYPWLHRWKPDGYPRPLTQDEMLAWVDHGEENMQALCDVHHRHRYLGVHAISGPIFSPQDLYTVEFEAYIRQQLHSHPPLAGNPE
jgi:hypothetical protein